MKRKLLLLLGIMAIVASVGAIITMTFGKSSEERLQQGDDGIRIVTSFYPMYILTMNLTDQVPGISLSNLTDVDTGCPDDYQVTTNNMKLLNAANIFVMNGGGIEGFMVEVMKDYPKLSVINLTDRISMLGEPGAQNNSITTSYQEDTAITGIGVSSLTESNPHVWLDPRRYMEQVENLKSGLINYLNTRTDLPKEYVQKAIRQIEENAKNYSDKVRKINNSIEENLTTVMNDGKTTGSSNQVIIFHDAFAYLADRVGLVVADSVEINADTQLSAGDIADIITIIQKNKIKLLFTEKQYGAAIANRIAAETGAKVYVIDSAVTGDGSKDSYLNAMTKNIAIVKDALK